MGGSAHVALSGRRCWNKLKKRRDKAMSKILTVSTLFALTAFGLASAQTPEQLAAQIAKNTTMFKVDCTRSVVSLITVFPMRCTEKPMHILWPNGRATITFIAVDLKGDAYNISFNANSDEQPTLRRYVMKLSDVRFGKLETDISKITTQQLKTFPVKGKCEIDLQYDKGKSVDQIACFAEAPKGVAKFDFATGPGVVENSKLNGSDP
jgi:hypothetical protein